MLLYLQVFQVSVDTVDTVVEVVDVVVVIVGLTGTVKNVLDCTVKNDEIGSVGIVTVLKVKDVSGCGNVSDCVG